MTENLRIALLTIVLTGLAGPVLADPSEEPEAATEEADPWELLRLLEGSWTGTIDGKLGTGTGVRQYDFVLGGRYLACRHESVRLPQEKSPKGDQHQELAIFSFDDERRKIVLREFMVEGVVSRYVCDTEDRQLVCVTEAVESGPGIRARLTLEVTDRYRFTEIYEIAWPGRELELYFTNRWTRSPKLENVWDEEAQPVDRGDRHEPADREEAEEERLEVEREDEVVEIEDARAQEEQLQDQGQDRQEEDQGLGQGAGDAVVDRVDQDLRLHLAELLLLLLHPWLEPPERISGAGLEVEPDVAGGVGIRLLASDHLVADEDVGVGDVGRRQREQEEEEQARHQVETQRRQLRGALSRLVALGQPAGTEEQVAQAAEQARLERKDLAEEVRQQPAQGSAPVLGLLAAARAEGIVDRGAAVQAGRWRRGAHLRMVTNEAPILVDPLLASPQTREGMTHSPG
jgi:hypothetical protein